MSYITDLQSVITGSVESNDMSRDAMARDGSIFYARPEAVVIPHMHDDIVAIARYLSKEAEQGNRIPVTVRGRGTDTTGAAIGDGVIIRMNDHMNRILDQGSDWILVEGGLNYGDLNRHLAQSGKFVPPMPAASDLMTVGGMIANNTGGSQSIRYGSIGDYVEELSVILPDGSTLHARPVERSNIHELAHDHSLGQKAVQGVSNMIESHRELITHKQPNTHSNASGYALWNIERGDVFDISKLFIGSEGTLGVISSAKLKTLPLPKHRLQLVLECNNLSDTAKCVEQMRPFRPSAIDVIDKSLISLVRKTNFQNLQSLLPGKIPQMLVVADFTGDDVGALKKNVGIVEKIIKPFVKRVEVITDSEKQRGFRKIAQSAAALTFEMKDSLDGFPFFDDISVRPEYMNSYISTMGDILNTHSIDHQIWGGGIHGDIHMRPHIPLHTEKHHDILLAIADDLFKHVGSLGGTLSTQHGDGIARTPYLHYVFGPEMVTLFEGVKDLFDPHGIFNPYVKVRGSKDIIKKRIRKPVDSIQGTPIHSMSQSTYA